MAAVWRQLWSSCVRGSGCWSPNRQGQGARVGAPREAAACRGGRRRSRGAACRGACRGGDPCPGAACRGGGGPRGSRTAGGRPGAACPPAVRRRPARHLLPAPPHPSARLTSCSPAHSRRPACCATVSCSTESCVHCMRAPPPRRPCKQGAQAGLVGTPPQTSIPAVVTRVPADPRHKALQGQPGGETRRVGDRLGA